MKRAVFVILALMLVCHWNASVSASKAEDEYYIICKPGSVINVRKSPKLHSEIVGCKFFGDQLIVDKEKNGFVHITNLNSEYTEGWIYKGFVSEDQPIEMMKKANIVSNARVAGRKYVNGKVIRWLQNGTEVMIYAASDEWCVTDKGYVKREFVKIWEQEDGC